MKRIMQSFLSIIIILNVLLLNGCATILKGTSEKVSINSEPSQSKVYINGTYSGKTPTQLKLSSNKSYQLEIKKEGYEASTVNISNNVGVGWIIADIVLAGLIGVVVDAATGSWFYLDATDINADLEIKEK